MGRPRTGCAFWHGNHWDIQVTLPDGSRSNRACLPIGVTERDARAESARLTHKAAAEGWERDAAPDHTLKTGNTVDVFAENWLTTRRDPKDASAHLRFHILPILRDHVMTAVTREDIERVVAALDEKVRAGEIAWKTAQNIFGTLSKMFEDATHAKRIELRVLKSNPAEGVRGPDRGEERQSAYLFPKEARALLACEKVPLSARVLYALAMYTGLRRGELAVLRVADAVLDGGYLSVHRAHDRVTKGTKSTKGRRARRVPIEPALMPLLVALTKDRDGAAPLVELPPNEKTLTRAGRMRGHLELAGITREELFADDEHRRPLALHDLRHSFATWLALAGATELQIQARLGHATTDMTQRYISEAEAIGRGDIGEPFGALPPELLASFAPISLSEAPKSMKSGAGHGIRKRVAPMIPSSSRPLLSSIAHESAEGDAPVSDAEIERAIVAAVTAGEFTIAKVLAAQLEDRRRARAPQNVISLAEKTRR